jgi:four helix bundle protein
MTSDKPLLADRLVDFGGRVCAMVRRAAREPALDTMHRQLVRCATAPAANYAEARDSVSARDYVYRMKVCVKELREALTWLKMLQRAGYRTQEIDALAKECDELIAIAVACIKKATTNPSR